MTTAWKTLGLSAGLIAVIAASGAFLGARAAPDSATPPSGALVASAAFKTFAADCTADQADLRPEPKWVGESYAGDNCWAPALPAAIDPTNSSQEQIAAALAALQSYKLKAGAYQRCIAGAVSSRKVAAAKAGKPLDAGFVTIESHRITASENDKKKADRLIAIARSFSSDPAPAR